MNLFPLGAGACPLASARAAAKAWLKLVCEVAQMMTAAHVAATGRLPDAYPSHLKAYKTTAAIMNNPMSRWVRSSAANYAWAAAYAEALNTRFRTKKGKPDHASIAVVRALAALPPPVFSGARVGSSTKRQRPAPSVFVETSSSPGMAGCTPFPLLYQMEKEEMEEVVGPLQGRPVETIVAALVQAKKAHLF